MYEVNSGRYMHSVMYLIVLSYFCRFYSNHSWKDSVVVQLSYCTWLHVYCCQFSGLLTSYDMGEWFYNFATCTFIFFVPPRPSSLLAWFGWIKHQLIIAGETCTFSAVFNTQWIAFIHHCRLNCFYVAFFLCFFVRVWISPKRWNS